jgi:hypothetical protein
MEMGPPERRLQISPNRATPQIAADEHDEVPGNHRLILLFAKTLADSEINDITAAVPSAFCYNSWPCFNSSACASER